MTVNILSIKAFKCPYLKCTCVYLSVCMCIVCFQKPTKIKQGIKFPGTGITEGWLRAATGAMGAKCVL